MRAILVIGLLLAHQAMADVPAERLHVLSRGVNLINIFDPQASLSNVHNEIDEIKNAGFTHVRFFIDPAWVWRPGEPAHLDQVIHAAISAKIGVILCMQSYKQPFTEDQVTTWTKAWITIAKHYANTSPDYLYFELANEPGFTAERWADIQETLRQLIRQIVPDHTLLLTGSPTSTSYALADLPPSPDDNVVYVFHEYQPMIFTHQGADWADPKFTTVEGLQYPPQPDNLKLIEGHADAALRPDIDEYRRLGTNVILHDVQPALDWAQKNHQHLIVTEFGVYRPFAPPPSRAAWLHDARVTLEKYGIGWTVWEYNGGFGIKPELDLGCGRLPMALGLCH